MVEAQAVPGSFAEPFTAPVPEPAPRRVWLRVLIVTAVVLAVLAAASVVVYARVFDVYLIPSDAMAPSLEEGDRVMVRGIAGDEVHRGDVVLVEVELPDGQPQQTIKRVIAVEGEQIVAVDGRVQIDGEPLDEPYLAPGTQTTDLVFQEVPDGHVFLMGDNRPNSYDSRIDGPYPHDAIVGLAVSTWPPPGDGF
jgi:signal peptidase I